MAVKEKVTFRLPAEIIQNATVAILLGDFNKWNPEEGIYLERGDDGSFFKELELEAGEYQYRYYLNDGRWVNDFNYTVASPAYGDDIRNCIICVETRQEQAQEHFPQDEGAYEDYKAEAYFQEDDVEGKTVAKEPAAAQKQAKIAKKPVVKKAPAKKETKKTEPVVNSGMFSKQYHEFTKIEGITPEIQELLYQADLRTYGALAKASQKLSLIHI